MKKPAEALLICFLLSEKKRYMLKQQESLHQFHKPSNLYSVVFSNYFININHQTFWFKVLILYLFFAEVFQGYSWLNLTLFSYPQTNLSSRTSKLHFFAMYLSLGQYSYKDACLSGQKICLVHNVYILLQKYPIWFNLIFHLAVLLLNYNHH